MAYVTVATLEELKFMCHKILPLVYDESLSYYETLCKIAKLLNDTIESCNQLNENVENINDRVNEHESRIVEVENEMTAFTAEIRVLFNSLKDEINSDVDNKLAQVDAKLITMQEAIDSMDATLADKIREIDGLVNSKLAELTEQVNKLINDALNDLDTRFNDFEYNTKVYIKAQLQAYLDMIPDITSVMVVDPTSGEQSPIQTVIDNLYYDLLISALNCYEFDHLELTCGELDTYMVYSIPRGLTVWEWMHKAKEWVWTPHRLKMRNFFTGKHTLYKQNIRINNALLKMSGSYTAKEFDSTYITADEYDNLALTAYNYDWHSNEIIPMGG